jgi:hypothetical protein
MFTVLLTIMVVAGYAISTYYVTRMVKDLSPTAHLKTTSNRLIDGESERLLEIFTIPKLVK